MRIAIFHLGFYYSGGGEKLVLEEMRGLRELGHEVACYAPFVDRQNCFPDVPEMKDVQTLLPSPPSWLPARDVIWLALSCLLVPALAFRFRRYDIFLGANQPGPWFAFVLSKLLRKPYAIYLAQPLRILHPRKIDQENGMRIREGDARALKMITKLFGWFIDWSDRRSVADAEIVLSNGKYVSEWLQEIYGRSTRICPAGCHPVELSQLHYEDRWTGELRVNGLSIEKPFILLSNRHAPQKRFEYALWAMKTLAREAPKISLLVTGQETSYTDQLRYLVKSLRIDEKVKFVGFVSEVDLSMLYQQAALYVYPSPEEDFGMGIVEAMAAGTPVVAWNNGGPTGTILDGSTGYLASPYDTEEFAERLYRLAASPALAERLGRNAHMWATEEFSYEAHNRILEASLKAALHSEWQMYQVKSSYAVEMPLLERIDATEPLPITEADEISAYRVTR